MLQQQSEIDLNFPLLREVSALSCSVELQLQLHRNSSVQQQNVIRDLHASTIDDDDDANVVRMNGTF
jgi:hypothetical protein